MPCSQLEASTWPAKEDLDTTGGRGSQVHNRLTVVIGTGSLVVEVATALAGQAQQRVSCDRPIPLYSTWNTKENGEGELRGQPAKPRSRGKMAVKMQCVCASACARPVRMCWWRWTAYVRCTLSRRQSASLRCRTTRTLSSCCARQSTAAPSRSTDTGWSARRIRTEPRCSRATLSATLNCPLPGDDDDDLPCESFPPPSSRCHPTTRNHFPRSTNLVLTARLSALPR